MKIIVDLGHPAHIHLFKNFIWRMEESGHEVLITARDKEILLDLLNAYGFEYITISKAGKNSFAFATELLKRDYKLFNLAKSYKPDILVGISESIAHVGKLLKVPSIGFTDTEHAKFSNAITFPFADVICTPSCFKKDIGKKQIRYNGYHELAYLHPNYFTPNPAVLNELGLTEDDTFIILRFVSWDAHHDFGHSGIQNKIELVQKLEKYGRVLITSEGKLGDGLEKYQIKVSPEKMHDLLYYASLYIGESPTMATESAILGTPAILISSWAYKAGNMEDLCNKYGLMFPFYNEDSAIKKALDLLENNPDKIYWVKRRQKLLNDKIDVTAFMIEFIENYLINYKSGKS